MPWAEISISVAREDAEAAEEVLESLGSLAITFEDDADNPVLEPGPGSTPLWPTVHVRGLFEESVDRETVMRGLQTVPGSERPQNLRWRDIGDENWERAWLDRFEPMRFGERLWIVPTGMQIPPEFQSNSSTIEIRLDPGLAFGTGTHPTTALCLEWIDGHEFEGTTVVDYGCGSGILAIAAALKGAKQVLCVDTDPQALEATLENARRNGVSERIEVFLPERFLGVLAESGADVVLANILAGPLVELAGVITGSAESGGKIVLSGILAGQEPPVVEAYQSFGTLVDVTQLDEWLRVVVKLK